MFAVTEDWYFWSHRKPLADVLAAGGCIVSIATRFGNYRAALADAGFRCIAITFERSLRHPLRDLRALFALSRAVTRAKPDVVHLVSLKPILLSAVAGLTHPGTAFVAAFTGMGYLFSTRDRGARWLRRGVVVLLRFVLRRRNTWIIVQNTDDLALLRDRRLGASARTVLIPGVGVDIRKFACSRERACATALVVLPARLIRDKGIEEFVAAAMEIKRSKPTVRFALVGAADPDNPAAIPAATIAKWIDAGAIEWWGHRSDMTAVYHEAQIVCLPSYREGLPKVLLEAAACGRPLIATDVAGCREVCIDGLTGMLVPPRLVPPLVDALIALLDSAEMRQRYGSAARALVEEQFSLDKIAAQTMAFYQRILAAGKGRQT